MLVDPFQGYKQGDQVMVWNQAYRYMTQSRQRIWVSPFTITFSLDRYMVYLTSSNGTQIPISVHLDFIRPYFPSIM